MNSGYPATELCKYLTVALSAAEHASKLILEVYNSDNFEAEKKGDDSPLTIADKKGHDAIAEILKSTGLPILSEEGKSIDFNERKNWDYFWMVDPLDGTKEFIKRNGEFTVNIALIKNGRPVLGVVAVPVNGEVFYGYEGGGACVIKEGKETKLAPRKSVDLTQEGLVVVASRSHMSPETEEFISKLKSPKLVSKGSSLKFLLLAEGKADLYPRYAPTMEWDTAAAHAIVNAVGLKVYEYGTTRELSYNKPNLLNPFFLVAS
jgi:3'(2'), 5'-bisphosphate nucleotidase